jgi:hypothetical protein
MIYRELCAAEFDSARTLFTQVFKKEVSPAWWHWKYRGEGLIDATHIGAFDARSSLCGHVGALVTEVQQRPLRSVSEGKGTLFEHSNMHPKVMIQICDVMVSDERRGQRASGFIYRDLMQRMAQHLAHRWPQGFAYGFPGMRPHLLGEKLGFYHAIARYGLSHWTPVEGVLEPLAWTRLYDWLEDSSLLAAPQSTRAAHQIVLARHRRYLAWRYEKHPEVSYQCWGIYKRGWLRKQLIGWLVSKPWNATQRLIVDGWTQHSGLVSPHAAIDAQINQPWLIWARISGEHRHPVIATQFRYAGDFELGTELHRSSPSIQARLRGDLVPFTAGDTDVF